MLVLVFTEKLRWDKFNALFIWSWCVFMFKLKNDGTSERQYLSLVEGIMEHGDLRSDRTGVGTLSIHGHMMRFDLSDGSIPLLTTKAIRWKDLMVEWVWFLSGDTSILPLIKQGVSIWTDWPHKKYVQETGHQVTRKEFEKLLLSDSDLAEKWGDLGPVYGHQWRKWQGPDGKVYDQLKDVIELLKKDPYSRRALFHGWNVAEISQMALPPCHLLYQFFVSSKNKLSMSLYQRSCDVGLGVPYNIAEASMFIHLMAAELDMEPGELVWFGHDVHLYSNHVEKLREELLPREPKPFPKFVITNKRDSIFDYTLEDVDVVGYEPHPRISLPVAV